MTVSAAEKQALHDASSYLHEQGLLRLARTDEASCLTTQGMSLFMDWLGWVADEGIDITVKLHGEAAIETVARLWMDKMLAADEIVSIDEEWGNTERVVFFLAAFTAQHALLQRLEVQERFGRTMRRAP